MSFQPGAERALVASLARRLIGGADKSLVEDSAWLLLDEARLVEGEPVGDAQAFAGRLRRLMEKAIG